jgi:feruloyl esterase
MRLSNFQALIIGVGLAACGREPPQDAQQAAASAEPMQCEALASLSIANTSITSAARVPAGAFTSPVPEVPGLAADYSSLPAFCRVAGSIRPTASSDIRFELWLPAEGWNGRFMQTGNGGAAGSIVYSSLAEPLLRGYAVRTPTPVTRAGAATSAGRPVSSRSSRITPTVPCTS